MQTYYDKTSTTSNKPWVIKVEDVTVTFGDYNALKNISFTLDQGEYLYIVGPNGSGKTTLIRLLTGLQNPTTGVYKIENASVGYLPQKLNSKKAFPITVEEVIYSGLKKQNFVIEKAAQEKISTWLEKMQIAHLINKPIGVLSGGQQQRVFLIRALISEPEVLILDEPTSALDPKFRNYFNHFIDELHKQGTTIIYVTHDLHDVNQPEKKVMFIDQEIKFYGSISEYHDFIKEGEIHV